jgi:hypothetical protein
VIADVSRELVVQIAPQELPIFGANGQAFFAGLIAAPLLAHEVRS